MQMGGGLSSDIDSTVPFVWQKSETGMTYSVKKKRCRHIQFLVITCYCHATCLLSTGHQSSITKQLKTKSKCFLALKKLTIPKHVHVVFCHDKWHSF